MSQYKEKILITGALGQIGTELTNKLIQMYGEENVVASGLEKREDIKTSAKYYETLDVTNTDLVKEVIKKI